MKFATGRGFPSRIGVLAVQGDVREHARILSDLGVDVVPVKRPRDLDGLDGVVIPGGESTTIDKLLRVFDLFNPLRDAIANGLPAYGSCAGMILLADRLEDPARDRDGNPQQTLGGLDVTVQRNAFGRQRESFEVDVDFAGLGDVHAVFIRAPLVTQAADDVEILALTPENTATTQPPGTAELPPSVAGRVVAVRSGPVLATSFHPEMTGERRVHELFINIVRGEV